VQCRPSSAGPHRGARRFNYNRSRSATLRISPRKYSKWIRVSHIADPLFRDSTGSGRKKIFAIVAPSRRGDVGYKTVRRVLIFDNHPDTLRLVLGQHANPNAGPSAPEPSGSWYLILVSILTMGALVGMFWPLFCAAFSAGCGPPGTLTRKKERASTLTWHHKIPPMRHGIETTC